jgi:hypothetical protein
MPDKQHIVRNLKDKDKLRTEAAEDIRYLLERGYRRNSAIRFVGDHYGLDKNERYILARTVFSSETASSRKKKKLRFDDLKDRKLLIDGYNVLITLESLLDGEEVWIGDDSFLRDIKGVFKNHSNGDITFQAVEKMLVFIKKSDVGSAEILLDTQMKNSGELAAFIRKRMEELSIQSDARTSKHVDFDLKNCSSDEIVATADGVIIDAVKSVVDIPGCIAANLDKIAEKLASNSSNSS